MAPKGATLRLSARSNKTESHVERMARTGLQKAADGLPEMDRLLAEGLPKAVEQFVSSLRNLQSRDDLLNSAVPLEPAKNLRQVVWHFRDLSWRTAVHPEQATKLGEALAEPLKIIQAISVLLEGMDLQSSIRGENPDNLAGALLLGLENWTLYCVLASSYGVPPKLVIEEVTSAILKSLKEMLRQIIGPLQASEFDRSKKAPGEGQAGDLPFSTEHASALCTSVAELLQALHEFLSRHRLAEDQLHQLIHIALSIFFLGEPNFRLCAAAEEVLVTIFSRHEALRSSVLQEFLSRAPRLPTGKRAKKFQMPATEESGAYGLSTWTHLLLRLCQSTCLPLREPIGSDVDFESVVECRPAAQSVISQLVAGLLQRLVLSRSKDEEARLIMEDFTDEVFSAAFKPMWPGALALLRQMVQQLIAFLQEKKQAGDITVREFTLKLLSRAEIRLWHHATQSSQARVELPQWTEPPEEVAKHAKEGRLLQHIALRVSLEDGRDMPWSEAARIVEAWDAELFLSKGAGDEQAEGLTSLSDDIVFLHLTLAFLSDECTVRPFYFRPWEQSQVLLLQQRRCLPQSSEPVIRCMRGASWSVTAQRPLPPPTRPLRDGEASAWHLGSVL
ncbi:Nipbl [Symbiodinium sp. CCMP2592]|nr:Nipbl [Symbiodinium sp. CCMP2592]